MHFAGKLFFERDVRVPAENLVGEKGRGLNYSLVALDGGRISIGALSIGLAQAALEEAVLYSKQREAFGEPIANFQAIQWMLADAATEIQAARLLVYYAAWLKHQGKNFSKEAAMAKLFSAQVAENVTSKMLEIFGGYGFTKEYPAEKFYRDAKIGAIYEGTSNMQLQTIAKLILSD